MARKAAKDVELVAVPEVTEPLDAFIARHEQAAQARGAVVVSISHPDAAPGVREGTYSGIRLQEGDPKAVYSDGHTDF